MMQHMNLIAFARGVPAPEALPIELLRDAASIALREDGVRVLSYGTGAGYQPLRELLAARHGVDVSRVVVTPGSLQGFALVSELLAEDAARDDRRARVIVENPTYDRPLLVLGRAGIDVEHVDIDHEGLVPTQVAAALDAAPASMIYTIPTFQNPAGTTMPEARRRQLLDLAAEHDTLVFEDDPYGLLHFQHAAPAPLFGRDHDADVIYASSFSKTISPGLRVGYLILPDRLAARVAQRANDTYISATLLGQATVHRFIENGHFTANVERCRTQLARRCDAICDALERHLPDATWVRPDGGYFIWVDLPTVDGAAIDATTLLAVAADHGISFVPGSAFGPGRASSVRLAFSSPALDQIDTGIARLADCVQQMMTPV